MTSDKENLQSVSGFLLSEIQSGATVQTLLDRVFDTWYFPSMFINISRHIENYSRYSSEYNPWDSVFCNGSLIHEYTDDPIRSILLHRNSRNKADKIKAFGINNQIYIIALVKSGNVPGGFILMHCPQTRSMETAMEICEVLADAIAFLTEEETASRLSDYDYTKNYIARELLQFDDRMGNASPAAAYTDYMTSPLWPSIKPNYRIAAIPVQEKDTEMLAIVEKEISLAYPKCYSLIKTDTLYFFFYELEPGASKTENQLTSHLKRVAENNSVVIALSSLFSDINRRQVFRRQAVDLSRMTYTGRPEHGLLEADDYYPEQLIFAASNRIGKESLMLNEIAYLKEYDEKEGTEYLKTLCIYLRNNGIVRHASDELHIQPKSLHYRINKICNILQRSREELLSDNALLLSSIAINIDSENSIINN